MDETRTDVPEATVAAAMEAARKTREYWAGTNFDVPADAVETFTEAVIRAAVPAVRTQALVQAGAIVAEPWTGDPMCGPQYVLGARVMEIVNLIKAIDQAATAATP